MELNFTKDGNAYVAEFEASGDFNVHIETAEECTLNVFQRTGSSGAFAQVESVGLRAFDRVKDVDFSGSVYPKTIQIRLVVNPSVATVTFA